MKTLGYILCSLILSSLIFAQENGAAISTQSIGQQTIAINPIFAPLGTITAEYERTVSEHLTVGVSGWYEYKEVKA